MVNPLDPGRLPRRVLWVGMLSPGASETLAWGHLTWPGHLGEVRGGGGGTCLAVSSAGADFSHCRNVLTVLILASPKSSSAIHNLTRFQDSEE